MIRFHSFFMVFWILNYNSIRWWIFFKGYIHVLHITLRTYILPEFFFYSLWFTSFQQSHISYALEGNTSTEDKWNILSCNAAYIKLLLTFLNHSTACTKTCFWCSNSQDGHKLYTRVLSLHGGWFFFYQAECVLMLFVVRKWLSENILLSTKRILLPILNYVYIGSGKIY